MSLKVKSICPLDCPDACGMELTVENDRITRIDGDPDHPVTQGFLCSKVRNNYLKKMYGSHRITRALIRTGPKGSGSFREISLDDAVKTAAQKIYETAASSGTESILPYSYAGNMGLLQRPAGEVFFNKIRSSVLLRTICSTAGSSALARHAGSFPGGDIEGIPHSDLIVIWGMNIRSTHSHMIPFINQARKNGAKLAVIDVYRNATAEMADYFYCIEPGKDAYLALGIARYLTENGYVDSEYINNFTEDFTDFASHLKKHSLEEYAAGAGVSLAELKELAELIGKSDRLFLKTGIGLTRNSRGENTIRSLASLAALKGLFRHDIPGKGFMFATGSFQGGNHTTDGSGLLPPEIKASLRTVNMIRLGEALNETAMPVKLMFVYNANPLAVSPDRNQVIKGLEREDLFTIVHEQVMTESALYADLIFPATVSVENTDVYRSFGHHYLAYTDPAVHAPGDCLSNFDLFRRIESELRLLQEQKPLFHPDGKPVFDFTETEFTETIEQRRIRYLDAHKEGGLSEGSGILKSRKPGEPVKSDLLQKYDSVRISGKWKFRFAAAPLHSQDSPYASVGLCREFDDTVLAAEYPFKLITPPHKDILNSTFYEFYETPGEVFMHPADAENLGLSQKNGTKIRLIGKRGFAVRILKITDKTPQGLLTAEGVFRSADPADGNINNITSMDLTETAGGGVFHESRVKISVV